MKPAQKVKHAIDLLQALRPAAFGMDRAARARQCAEIHALLPRRARELPSAREFTQLAELSGGAFSTARRQIVARLTQWLDQLATAGAPQTIHRILARLAPDQPALSRDADEAWRARNGGAFKSAVVLAGAVAEGLLHAALEGLGESAGREYCLLHPRRKPPPRADAYTVDDAILVLVQARRLSSAAAHFARGLKDLRNLVHPALERRHRVALGQYHADAALGALELLAQDLSA